MQSSDSNWISTENTDIIAFLVAHGAQVNSEDDEGFTPLHHAIGGNSLCAIKTLVDLGADLHYETPRTKGTILDHAISNATTNTVAYLLEMGVNPYHFNRYNRSPYHTAGICGTVEVMDLLEKYKVPFDLKDMDNATSLHLASWFGQSEAVTWLLERGMSPNLKDMMGWTPLHYAAEWGRLETAKILLSHSASCSVKDNQGRTPLHYAQYAGHQNTVELLEFFEDSSEEEIDPRTRLSASPFYS